MSFVSYSQNLEDLMLYRALKDVKEGFYIDVGANDPVHDSVTKAFYDAGWHGVNIEPELQFFKKLKYERIRDINLNYAVSSKVGEITLFVSSVRGRSTTNADVVTLEENNTFGKETRRVKTISIDDIVQKHNIKTIHFLKIDVEGAEEDVLKSITLTKNRPWILLVEATQPGTNKDISQNWEYLIIKNNYTQVYFDGVNRYYLADEKKELAIHFAYPPNILDDYIHYEHKTALQRATYFSQKLQNERAAWKSTHEELLEEINTLKEEINTLKIEKNLLLQSKSWKVTKPLRILLSYFKKHAPPQSLHADKRKKPKISEPLSQEAQTIYEELDCELL